MPKKVEHDDNPLGVMRYDVIFSIKESHRHVTPEFLSDDVLALFFQFLRAAGWYVSSFFLFFVCFLILQGTRSVV